MIFFVIVCMLQLFCDVYDNHLCLFKIIEEYKHLKFQDNEKA